MNSRKVEICKYDTCWSSHVGRETDTVDVIRVKLKKNLQSIYVNFPKDSSHSHLHIVTFQSHINKQYVIFTINNIEQYSLLENHKSV